MSFLDHLLAELRESGGTFLRYWWRTIQATMVLFVVLGLVAVAPSPDFTAGEKAFLILVGAPLYGAFKGVMLGFGVAVLGLLYRLVGWTLILPVVTTLIGLYVVGWFGSGLTAHAFRNVGHALGTRAGELGAFPAARAGHPVVLLIFIPVLLLHFGSSPEVLAAILWLLLVLLVILGVGGIGGFAVSLPVVFVVAAGRIRDRAEDREESTPDQACPG